MILGEYWRKTAASVATAPNNCNDDHSGMENNDPEDEDKGLGNDGTYSNATVNLDLHNAVLKNKELTKQARSLRVQYNRAVKQRDDIVPKHAQVLENRKTAYGRAKACH